MYRKEVNSQSPLRILEKSIHGGLGKGNLGIVMARAGVGKTACLVQIGLDDLMRERAVLHISLEQTVDHVQSWYDALFEDLATRVDLDDKDAVADSVRRRRKIVVFTDHDLWPERLQKTVDTFKTHLKFEPAAILVDGYPWDAHTTTENAAMIGAFKAYAKMLDAELWMSAQTHRGGIGPHPTKLDAPWDAYSELIDVAIFLDPEGDDVTVRLLKDHDHAEVSTTSLHLHPVTMRLVAEAGTRSSISSLPNSVYTLLSGGAAGAEAEFGACAERFGLAEMNFSFEGHDPARKRGLVRLTADELDQGAVSPVYVEAHMHRKYPKTDEFSRILKSIWHQVSTAGQVISVGTINEDDTVKGGTGWAVELARHWHKPVFVFDQSKEGWFTWAGKSWVKHEVPRLQSRRFAGTGTRRLNDSGRKAIHEFFELNFGS